MTKRRRKNDENPQRTVHIAGRDWPVLDRLAVGRRSYLILRKMTHGARERYMAFDPHAGPGGELRSVCIFPKSSLTQQQLRLFKRLSQDNNPNFPMTLDYQSQADRILLVSTWVKGPDLRCYLNAIRAGQTPRPSTTEIFRLVRGLAHGLRQLHHRHAIVHGDIKPENVILTRHPSRLVLIDYGSAWPAARTQTREHGDGMSLAYAARETLTKGFFVDGRSDQFSTSVLLYELLTLRLPYDNLGGQAGRPEFAATMKDKLETPSRYLPDRGQIPKELWKGIDQIVKRGLEFDPDARYPTSDTWVDAFSELEIHLKPRAQLGRINSRLTQVIGWFAKRWHGT